MDDGSSVSGKVALGEGAGVATTTAVATDDRQSESSARGGVLGDSGTGVVLPPSSPAEENTSSAPAALSTAGVTKQEGRKIGRIEDTSGSPKLCLSTPSSSGAFERCTDTRVSPVLFPEPAPEPQRISGALMADTPADVGSTPAEISGRRTTEGSSGLAVTGRSSTDKDRGNAESARDSAAEEKESLDATGNTLPAAPTGSMLGTALAIGPEEAPNIGETARAGDEEEDRGNPRGVDASMRGKDTKSAPGFDPLPQEITSIYAAIASGIPGAVPEVLGCIGDRQAVDELRARNAKLLRDRRKTVRGSGVVPTGHSAGDSSSGGGGGGGGGGFGALEGKAEELETLVMLAARSRNLDMFNAVLQAMRLKLPPSQQTRVLEATDMQGRSLAASAAEGGSFAVVKRVVDVMGGEAAVFARMSSKETGYFVKMAAKSGSVETFNGVTDMMARNGKIEQAMKEASESGATGASVLVEAASSGRGEMVDAVVVAMSGALTEDAVVRTITAADGGRQRTTALLAAAEARNLGAVTAVIKAFLAIVDGSISNSGSGGGDDEEIRSESEPGTIVGIDNAFIASRAPLSTFTGSRRRLSRMSRAEVPDTKERRSKNIAGMIMAKNARGMTALSCAATNGDLEIMFSVMDVMSKFLSRSQISEACSSSFSKCCANLPASVDKYLEVLAYLLQHGATPASKAFRRLCSHVTHPVLKERLLGAVSSADNPFIPGMNLSVACTVASIGALEGDKRRLSSMQAAVDELLLEILDHMPQTVMGFKNEMNDCSAIFEPETVISSYRGCQGPLSVALTHRRQMETYCTTPLVLDYMSRKFTKGLPGLMDREGVLLHNSNFTQMGQTLSGDGLIAEGRVLFLGMALQSDYGESTLSSITFFPGARFIIAGLLSRPGSYYKVPALRMALDLVTYLFMLAIFGGVILHQEDSAMETGEIVFATYIFGAILAECREIYADPFEYKRDPWNVLDICSLIPLLIAIIFRAVGGAGDQTAQACYALGAPFVFARILYFAQALPSQGPMIQVFFSMTGLLVQFGTIMFVVMLGFVMSFYSLFKNSLSYGQVWEVVFKAMLGETDYFDDLSGTRFENVGTFLLVVYILVLTIMMLNLLVAVLSTAHARVDNDADLEYKVTKARLIQRYTQVVGIDRLSPPYNLVQWIITLPFVVAEWCYSCRAPASSTTTSRSTTASSFPSRPSSARSLFTPAFSKSTAGIDHKPHGAVKSVKGFFGRAVFWLVLGPVAVFAGWALWTASIVKAPFVVWEASRNRSLCGKIARASLAITVCAIGAPVWLLVMWIRGGFRGLMKGSNLTFSGSISGTPKDSPAAVDTAVTRKAEDASEKVVTTTLEASEGALAVSELQLFLDDPMSDPAVRRDEETRATTVEHVKLLRNRLEATNKVHMGELRAFLEKATGDISRQLERARLDRRGGGIGSHAGGGAVDDTANRACVEYDHGCDGGEDSPGLHAERPRNTVSDGSSELDDRLETLASALERRMVAMMDERLDALAERVDAILAPLKATQE